MKKTILILIAIIVLNGCKKDKFEKKIREVTVEWSGQCMLKFPGDNFSNCITGSRSYYKKQGDLFVLQTQVCAQQTSHLVVKAGKKVIYDDIQKIHNVSVSIP